MTAADIDAANFGVALSVKTGSTSRTAYVDYIQITVTYHNAGVGTVSWTNPGGITADDSSYAQCSLGGSAVSHYLWATNFGFGIPTGATINGVQVSVLRESSSSSTSNNIQDNVVSLIKGGAVTGSNKATATYWPDSMHGASYGGTADLWGTSLTAADIDAANFGVALSVKTGSSSRTAYCRLRSDHRHVHDRQHSAHRHGVDQQRRPLHHEHGCDAHAERHGRHGSGVAKMQFSNDNTTWSGWETYATTKSWTLASGDGLKTVYAQFKDVAGNVTQRDRPPPSPSIQCHPQAWCRSTAAPSTPRARP